MRAVGASDQSAAEAVRRILNSITAAKATAQLLERTAGDLPDDVRAQRGERLRAIVAALELAASEARSLTEQLSTPQNEG